MALRDGNGNVLTKAQFQGASTTAVTPNTTTYTLQQDVWEDMDLPGGTTTRTRRLKYRKGQVISAADYAAVYGTAQGSGAATFSAVTPTNPAVAGGTVLTITGTNLADCTGVTIAGGAGTALTVLSDQKIQVTAPAHAAGVNDIVLQHPGGNVTATGAVTYA
jgi:hypothetical protein